MRLAPTQRSSARPGFTLVELLAVIAIIAVLIGLTTAAVQKVRWRTLEVKTRNDIAQLSLSVDTLKTAYQVDYIPSRIVLREDGRYGDYNSGGSAAVNNFVRAIEVDSETFLKKMWPRLLVAGRTGNPAPASRTALTNSAGNFMDWNGDGAYTQGDAGAWILEGDQVLVFFLGGIQRGGACQGFSTNKQNPTLAGTATNSPTYDFPMSRLQVFLPNQFRSNQFMSYMDSYGTAPYAFFSSWGGQGYNRYGNTLQTSDCTTLGLQPYFDPSGKFYNKDGFQIISAGYDGHFGPGNLFDSSVGVGLTGVAVDDLTNFHPSTLGTGLK